MTIIFGASAKPGDTYTIDKMDTNVGSKLNAHAYKAKSKDLQTSGYRKRVNPPVLSIIATLVAMLLIATAFIGQVVRDGSPNSLVIVVLAVAFSMTIFAVIWLLSMRPLTKKGSEM